MVKEPTRGTAQQSVFIRILKSSVEERGQDLKNTITQINDGDPSKSSFDVNPMEFRKIPGSPFAYWVGQKIRSLFQEFPPFEGQGRTVKQGLATADDFRFVRAWWEVPPEALLDAANGPDWRQDLVVFQEWCREQTYQGKRWVPFAKGGEYSPFYSDIHLVVNWEDEGDELRNFYHANGRLASRVQNTEYYFRPGITWPLRTSGSLAARVFPTGTVFSHKGPVAFPARIAGLQKLLAVMLSLPFRTLVELLVSAGEIARSYEVGVIQRMPFPELGSPTTETLTEATIKAVEVRRRMDSYLENTRSFCLPFTYQQFTSIRSLTGSLQEAAASTQAELASSQVIIDDTVSASFGATELANSGIDPNFDFAEMGTDSEDDDENNSIAVFDISNYDVLCNILMYCLGVAFGRWDIRFALDFSLLPKMQDPFDPVAICPPGALVNPGGLPATSDLIVSEPWLRARLNVITLPGPVDGPLTIADAEYPLPITWDGILVDDAGHAGDIVSAVRRVFELIWGKRAGDYEEEVCQILGCDSLRTYFVDANKGFFNFHVKHYSKSRRKAPIYWLLQSTKRNFSVWLYYHRLTPDTLFQIIQKVLDPKLALEEQRLEESQTSLKGSEGGARKAEERRVADQLSFLEELKDFKDKLEKVAALELKPDLNDGVLLNIAPLWELVPWKEVEKTWKKLLKGDYEWSSIGKQLRERGLVK